MSKFIYSYISAFLPRASPCVFCELFLGVKVKKTADNFSCHKFSHLEVVFLSVTFRAHKEKSKGVFVVFSGVDLEAQ